MSTASRTYFYCRVSTSEQTTANQVAAIEARGFSTTKTRIIEETISGVVAAMDRPLFANLVKNKMESGDVLICLKLDRLGRNNIDVLKTIEELSARGIKIVSLDLASVDLTSTEGKLILGIMSAYSEFEKSRLRDRTMDGLQRAKAEGKVTFGRPKADVKKIQKLKAGGMSQSAVATEMKIGIATVKRHWNVIQ